MVFFGFTCCDQWHILVCTYTHFTCLFDCIPYCICSYMFFLNPLLFLFIFLYLLCFSLSFPLSLSHFLSLDFIFHTSYYFTTTCRMSLLPFNNSISLRNIKIHIFHLPSNYSSCIVCMVHSFTSRPITNIITFIFSLSCSIVPSFIIFMSSISPISVPYIAANFPHMFLIERKCEKTTDLGKNAFYHHDLICA